MAETAHEVTPEEALASIPALQPWLEDITPEYNWRWPHNQLVINELEMVTWGMTRHLILLEPPRHGKSELVTVRYPAYRLDIEPSHRNIVGCYGADLAEKFSRKTRKLVEGRVQLDPANQKVLDWATIYGGGHRAAGVGGGVTGMGANLIIVDDPVKSREEAESPAYREKVWDWFTNDLYTRREPGAAVIVVMTPWHKHDLQGRIQDELKEGMWRVVRLPALAEEGDLLGRTPGAALCPERFDEKALEEIHQTIGPYAFSALYQCSPTIRSGGLFKYAWFQKVQAIPTANVVARVRYWDTAGTEGDGDFTVGVRMSKVAIPQAQSPGDKSPPKLIYWYVVEDVVKGQWSPGHRDAVIKTTVQKDGELFGKHGVKQWYEREAGVGGAERTQAIVSMLAGYAVHTEPATGSKELRAEPFASQAEVGNVKVVKAPWTEDYLETLCAFGPGCAHDDDVDASSGAFNKLADAARPWAFGSYR